jgi:hypothetical protein
MAVDYVKRRGHPLLWACLSLQKQTTALEEVMFAFWCLQNSIEMPFSLSEILANVRCVMSLKHRKKVREAGHKPRRSKTALVTPEKGNFYCRDLVKLFVFSVRAQQRPRQFEIVA